MEPMMAKSLVVWGLFWLLFLGLEMPAVFGVAPWHTFSTTATFIVRHTGRIGAVVVIAGLSVLAVHFVAPKTFDKVKKQRRKDASS